MKIAFACPKCGKRLTADASLAGRGGRCRECGSRVVVPAVRDAAGGPRGGGSAAATPGVGSLTDDDAMPDWRTAVASQLVATPRPASRGSSTAARAAAGASPASASGYTLRPVTPPAVPAIARPGRAAVGFPDPMDSSADEDFTPTLPPVTRADPEQSPPSQALVAYRWFFWQCARLTTWISETSYTISFIVIILAIASGMTGRHTLAQWGTLAVVVLNLVGLGGDIANLVTLSFRRDPLRGALFLLPPFTLYYLWSDWDRYRETVCRMRIPLVTLAVVIAAYLYLPWLRGGTAGEGAIVATVERTICAVDDDFGRPQGIVGEGLEKARAWLREVPLPDPASLPGLPHGDGQAPDRPRPDGGP